jgi:hypothetical protein
VTSCNGLNYLKSMGTSEQLFHLQTGKLNSLLSNEPNKKSHKVALLIYHQNLQGRQCKTDEITNFLHPELTHILCLSEHYLESSETRQFI